MSFDNELLKFLNNNYPKYPYFNIDSLSDPENLHYASEVIKNAQKLLFIGLFDRSKNTKGLVQLINYLRKRDNVYIVFLGRNPIPQLRKGLEISEIESTGELILETEKWIQENMKGSASS